MSWLITSGEIADCTGVALLLPDGIVQKYSVAVVLLSDSSAELQGASCRPSFTFNSRLLERLYLIFTHRIDFIFTTLGARSHCQSSIGGRSPSNALASIGEFSIPCYR